MITPESFPFKFNPEALRIINGHGPMMVDGFQAWDMRELGNVCHGDACRLKRFTLRNIISEVWQRVS